MANPIQEEQMWEWVDEGSAESHLERLKSDPEANPEEVDMLEEIINLDQKIKDLPMFSKTRVNANALNNYMQSIYGTITNTLADIVATVSQRVGAPGIN